MSYACRYPWSRGGSNKHLTIKHPATSARHRVELERNRRKEVERTRTCLVCKASINAEQKNTNVLLSNTKRTSAQILKKSSKNHSRLDNEWDLFLSSACWRLLKSRAFDTLLELYHILEPHQKGQVLPKTAVLEAVVKYGEMSTALEYLKTFPEHANKKFYTRLLNRSAKEQDFNSAHDLFRTCCQQYESTKNRSIKPDGYMYRRYIEICTANHVHKEAMCAFEEYLKHSHTPAMNVCNAIIENSISDFTQCQALLEKCLNMGFVPDVSTMNAMMKSALLAEAFEECESQYNSMRSIGISPDTETFCILLEAFGSMGNIARAQATVNQMLSVGLQPNHTVWMTLLRTVRKRKMVNIAQQVWLKMQRFMQVTGEKPSVDLYNEMMKIYMITHEGHSVLEVIHQMDRAGTSFNSSSYFLAIEACKYLSTDGIVRVEDMDKGWNYYNQMLQSGISPSKEILGILMLMACQCKAGEKFKDCLKAACKIYGPDVVHEFSRECTRYHLFQGKVLTAWKIYEESWYKWTHANDKVLFNLMLDTAVAHSEFSRAFTIMKHMKSIGFSVKDTQILALEDAMVEKRFESNLDLMQILSEVDDKAGVVQLNVHGGSARDIRFQILSALNSLKKSESKLESLQIHMDCSLNAQIALSLLENDLKLSVQRETDGPAEILHIEKKSWTKFIGKCTTNI